ncbi:MAG: hypothetical protein ACQERB_00950 [Promethearchaeati archaeon]
MEKKQKGVESEIILELIEDQIAFCTFAIQDSKCDPTKFITFND